MILAGTTFGGAEEGAIRIRKGTIEVFNAAKMADIQVAGHMVQKLAYDDETDSLRWAGFCPLCDANDHDDVYFYLSAEAKQLAAQEKQQFDAIAFEPA